MVPPPVRDLVEQARKVAQVYLEFRKSKDDEASERVRKRKLDALIAELERLTKRVASFEKMLAARPKGPAPGAPATDWNGFFRASAKLIDLLGTAARGTTPETVRKAKDFIEGEFQDLR